MNLFRIIPATIATFAMVFGSAFPASAVQQLEGPDDVDDICQYSEPHFSDASKIKVDGDNRRNSSQVYQTERRAMAQKVMEVTVSAEQLALIGYDHVTGLLSISGFQDYPLFSGRHFLRFREGCALHFEVEEAVARDWSARVRMGGAGLKIGFLLNAHDNYEQAFCEVQERVGVVGEGSSGVSRHVVLSDLLYATLIDADGKELSTYHSELGHRVYLRGASLRMDGQQKKAAIPRVEVTSLVWTGAVSPVESGAGVGAKLGSETVLRADSSTVEILTSGPLETLTSEPVEILSSGSGKTLASVETSLPKSLVVEDAEQKRGRVGDVAERMDAWWRNAIEAAVYPCYQRGLARNGRLQGAFVMRMSAAEQGRGVAEVLLDTLQVDDVSSCILDRVRAIRMPVEDTRRWTSVKATMLFMLE